MPTKTITKKTTKISDFITIPRVEYEDLKARAIPQYYLAGKKANKLDSLVEEGLREYKAGKTESWESFLKREYPRLYKKHAH